MEIKHKSVSLSGQIFEKLEKDILSGKYERGKVLTETALSTELGVSRTPIREALRMLADEHITQETSKGSVVVGITKKDVDDIFKIRIAIEGLAARECVENITDEEIEELRETVELQDFYIKHNNIEQARDMDSRFHEQIYRFTKSPSIYYTLLQLHRKTMKYRRAVITDHQNAEVSFLEHKSIFDAIEKRDSVGAERLITIHINNARQRMITANEDK